MEIGWSHSLLLFSGCPGCPLTSRSLIDSLKAALPPRRGLKRVFNDIAHVNFSYHPSELGGNDYDATLTFQTSGGGPTDLRPCSGTWACSGRAESGLKNRRLC